MRGDTVVDRTDTAIPVITSAHCDWLGVQNVIFSSMMSVSVGQGVTIPCRKVVQETKLRTVAQNTVVSGYNDIGLYDTSLITSDILWYQLIPYR
jgi:hypothetical protein